MQHWLEEEFLNHLPARIRLPALLGRTSSGHLNYVRGFWIGRRSRAPRLEEQACGQTFSAAASFYAWERLRACGIGKRERRGILARLNYALRAHEDIIVCHECGAEEDLNGYSGAEEQRGARLCRLCFFWTGLVTVRDQPNRVRESGRHYTLSAEDGSFCGFRGFGGSHYVVDFTDGRRVRTSNMWSNGEIPWWFRDRLPDNAVVTAANDDNTWRALPAYPPGATTPARTGLE